MSSPPPLRYGGAGGYGKTMLAKALAHNASPQTTSLPLRHVWRKRHYLNDLQTLRRVSGTSRERLLLVG
jgi:hypothetical protein